MTIGTLGCIVAVLALATTACQPEAASPVATPASAPTATANPVAAPALPTVAPAPVATEAAYAPGTIALIDRYATQAQALSAQLRSGADAAAAAKAAEDLLKVGASIVPAFVERHPHCGDYMAAALKVRDGWRTMDAATLERDFHKDGALPQVQGDADTCYHMKDLVVHPATAIVLLSQPAPDIEGAQREITEVVAHAHIVKQG